MLTDDDGFYLKKASSKCAPGIYLAQVSGCIPECAEGEPTLTVAWRLQIVGPTPLPSAFRWRIAITSMETFEDLRDMFTILGIELGHVNEINEACGRATGRLVFIQIVPSGAVRLLQEASRIRRFPPFWERMKRAEAVLICKRFGLDAFLKGLKRYTFLDERQPGDLVQARFARSFTSTPRRRYVRRNSSKA